MKRIGLTLMAILLGASPLFSQIISVPSDQTTIQAAIDVSVDGDTVLVEEGTYLENINFKGKAITVASQFILDGDTAHISKTLIDGSMPAHPDTASVVTLISGEDSTSVLSGFTITGGNGTKIHLSSIGVYWKAGGGINIFNSGGKIVDNIISGNNISSSSIQAIGGGISAIPDNNYRDIIIKNNRVLGNEIISNTYAQGGGINAGSENGYTLVEGNWVSNNKATCSGYWKANAGGIMLGTLHPWSAQLIVRNNRIKNNEIHCVASQGGGIFLTFIRSENYQSGIAGIQIYNNVIANNYSQDRGGGIAIWDQSSSAYANDHPNPLIYNNTIVGNTAKETGGIFNYKMNALLMNNIISNNATSAIAPEISLEDINYGTHYTNQGRFQSFNNDIHLGWPGAGNINKYPEVDNEDFTLSETSPCIGRGIDTVHINENWYYAPVYDLEGADRLTASTDREIDMGALESPYERLNPQYDSEHIINVPEEESTIQAAINAASKSDTVLVAPGLYYENINFRGKAITVMSHYGMDMDEDHKTNTVIDGSFPSYADSASVVSLISGEDTTSVLNGFTITKGRGSKVFVPAISAYSKGGGGILIFESGGKIINNRITGNIVQDDNLVLVGGGILFNSSEPWNANMIIRKNLVSKNEISGLQTEGGGLFFKIMPFSSTYKVEKSTIEVYNNIISNNISEDYGGAIGLEDHNLYGDKWEQPVVVFFNNTITGNKAADESGLYCRHTRILLANNIFRNDLSAPGATEITLDQEDSDLGVKASVIETFNNNIQGGYPGLDNLDDDPGFKQNSFLLDNGSPCIGAGTNMVEVSGTSYFAPVNDYYGNPRPNSVDEFVDIGAIESDLMVGFRQIVIDNHPIQVYPNPTNNFLTIETEQPNHHSIEIISLSGQLIYCTEMDGSTKQIDMTQFSKGVYFVTVRSKEFVGTEKVVRL